MQGIQKAVTAVLGGMVVILTPFVPGIEAVISPDVVQGAAALITAGLVYVIPNKE